MFRKAISFTLTLYVLLLLTQPCQDVFALPHDAGSKTMAVSVGDKPADSECENETCSPFCICSCCSLSVINCAFTTATDLETVSMPNAGDVVNYTDPYATAYQPSIWQPPKN